MLLPTVNQKSWKHCSKAKVHSKALFLPYPGQKEKTKSQEGFSTQFEHEKLLDHQKCIKKIIAYPRAWFDIFKFIT